jgi:hypothetical protein
MWPRIILFVAWLAIVGWAAYLTVHVALLVLR